MDIKKATEPNIIVLIKINSEGKYEVKEVVMINRMFKIFSEEEMSYAVNFT